ncbi:chymotrypsin-1-like [Spodoptera litura]|uniref:Chymotrypsin-1-like n=1 Tax=Spodoptera litura TaxID=69820 RepID=A0A9J7E9G3_SPOLT|nr:chymotrypsin-1-like [Spodoptera litura]
MCFNISLVFRTLPNMDYKVGLLVYITLLIGSFALPTPEDDLSRFFDHTDDANARIIGGTEVAAGRHPHMAALFAGIHGKIFICGGSLVTKRTVLTAAICVNVIYSNSIIPSARVAVGSNRWDRGTEYTLLRNVSHPDFEIYKRKNDISVLITSTDVVLSSLVQPVALTYDFVGGGVPAIVAGWGSTTDDIGGALLRADNGQQFGIVSWGFPCAFGYPDVYVRISAYESWLKSVIV